MVHMVHMFFQNFSFYFYINNIDVAVFAPYSFMKWMDQSSDFVGGGGEHMVHNWSANFLFRFWRGPLLCVCVCVCDQAAAMTRERRCDSMCCSTLCGNRC